MGVWLPTVCWLVTAGVAPVETGFVQVSPTRAQLVGDAIVRSPGQGRAVVLMQGLHLHPWNHQNVAHADLRSWQLPGSVLVRTLAKHSDVFAFTYGQTAPVTEIAELPAFGEDIKRLRHAGYAEIVLVGFSAGGLVARQFVEDNPAAGVTRVVQVCAPNEGSPLAQLKIGFGAIHKPFLQSLTSQFARLLPGGPLPGQAAFPADVDFVCVVGTGLLFSDGVVSTRSQWPADLQAQGVPAVSIGTEHWQALHGEQAAKVIARLVRQHQPRWSAAQIAAMRKQLWGEKASAP